MSGGLIIWLCGTMAVFVTANAVLKSYAGSGNAALLIGALALFCIGNLMMVRLMRESGLGVAVAISSVVQLVVIGVVAFVVFGERPTAMQLTGMALGVAAVALIAWPTGGRA